MSKINSKFENWENYLTKFIGRKMYSLDIEANTGEVSYWMLVNLCMNPYSKVYSIDTWIKCENCDDIVERRFNENIAKTENSRQNVKIKLQIKDALIKLKKTGVIIFDFIYINIIHKPDDLFMYITLSWDILNDEGILIINNSKKNNSENSYGFKIKYAIDTFISINKLQLEVLEIGYYYIIKKINQRYSRLNMIEYNNLFEEINTFKTEILDEIIFNDVINEELEFDLKIIPEVIQSKNIPDINKDGVANNNLLPIIYDMKDQHNIMEFYFNLINKYNMINNDKYNIISLIKLTKEKILFNYLINIDLYNKYIQNDKNNKILSNYNYYTENNKNNKINLLLKNTFDKITTNNIIIDTKNKYNSFINNKYNYIFFHSFTELYIGNKNLIHNIYILIFLCAALNIQELGGNLILYANIYVDTELITECVYILKKFYKKVIIYDNNKPTNLSTSFYIIAKDFLGIEDNEKKKINLLINNIYDNISENNSVSIFKNYDKKIFNKIKTNINNFVNKKMEYTIKILTLYDKIYNFKKKNNEALNNNIKLILFKFILNKIISIIT